MTVECIEGPIVSSSDLEAHIALFCGVFHQEVAARQTLDVGTTERVFGVHGHAADVVTLRTPGAPFGVRLIQFSPLSSITVRSEAQGRDTNAPKVIDFYAKDFDAGVAHAKSQGFRVRDDIADYKNDLGTFREAHIWGPDSVVCAVISGPPGHIDGVVTVRDRLFSEPHSMSGPVDDLDGAVGFLTGGFGLDVVSSYELADSSFDAMVGSDQPIRLRAANVGLSRETPYFGVINYGLPRDSTRSLRDIAHFPNRGLIGATLIVTEIDRTVAASAKHGGVVKAPVADTHLEPYGAVRSAVLTSPFGATYHLIEL